MRGWMAAAAAIGLIVAACWVALFIGAARLIRRSAAATEQHHQEMKQEFDHLEQFPGATLVRRHDAFKLGQGLVGATYTTAAPYTAIRAHYDRVTARNGWSIVCEKPMRDWGRDFGGRARDYRKGPYRASIEYAGEHADYGWTYALNVTCGLGRNCQ